MKYIIFDIDGTLTDTTKVDDHCYTQAIEDIFGFKDFSTEYGNYEHTTDSGIINQLFRERLGRTFTPAERDSFIAHFCGLLEAEYLKSPSCIREISKAGSIIDTLCNTKGISVGLATGGWEESALFKLRCAGININHCTAASFAQDAMPRQDIISHTIRKMNEYHGRMAKQADIVYIGDGSWDHKAAGILGISFIGIDNKRLDHLTDIIKIMDYDELHQHIGLETWV